MRPVPAFTSGVSEGRSLGWLAVSSVAGVASVAASVSADDCSPRRASPPPPPLPPPVDATSTMMIGVPTSTVAPSATSSSLTTPANGLGSSTSAFAVSISTMIWFCATLSPTLTCQRTMSASVRPSPTSGSLNCLSDATSASTISARRWISRKDSGRRRRARGRGRAGSAPRGATAGRAWQSLPRAESAPASHRSSAR